MFDLSLTFDEWRERARPLLSAGVEPKIACAAIAEGVETASIATESSEPRPPLALPGPLMRLLDSICCFRSGGRYELMYRLAWRTVYENRKLLEDAADADVRSATLMDSAIRRDVHKMHAFVRFREILAEDGDASYFAWFEPEHEILRRGSVFFVKRFPNMKWTIATPQGAAVWDKIGIKFFASPDAGARPQSDVHEELWRTYYRSICNVARINVPAMQREMPQKYWKNLPEAVDIGNLVREARTQAIESGEKSLQRTAAVERAAQRALADGPPPGDGPQSCQRCDLWRHATQAVLGTGSNGARIMLVGEQPGDVEDLQGLPFVGPAGRVLDQAIAEAGLIRSELYITNAVKHFKWEPRGKRRLHKRPDPQEITACNIWLEKEIAEMGAPVIVALGATALRALVGSTTSIEAARRQNLVHASGAAIVATYHPSAILRAEGERAASLRAFLIEDLMRAKNLANSSASAT